jgi:hypothetical protein
MPDSRRGGSRANRTAATGAARPAREDPPPASAHDTHSGPRTPGAAPRDEAGADTARPPVCSIAFCPICTFVTAVGDARPELLDHLILASREVLLAVRALIDARLEGTAPPAKLERLTIG